MAGKAFRSSGLSGLITHFILCTTVVVAAIYLFHWENPVAAAKNSHYFNWHPMLMVIAFVFCFGEAMISYRLFPFSHATQKFIHFTLQTLAMTASSLAIYFIFKFHAVNHILDLYSLHACVGLFAYILFGLQYVFGVVSFYMGAPEQCRAGFVPWHRYVGVVAFVFIYTALLTGVLDRQRISWSSTPLTDDRNRMGNALGMFILFSMASVLYHFAPAGKEKVKNDSVQDALLP